MLGKIYKITNNINNKIYIGQTKQSLNERWYKHCSKPTNDKYHFFMPIKQAIFKLCRCSVYNLIKRYNIEYNISKSVQNLT